METTLLPCSGVKQQMRAIHANVETADIRRTSMI